MRMQSLRTFGLFHKGNASTFSLVCHFCSSEAEQSSPSLKTLCNHILCEHNLDKVVEKFLAYSKIARFRCNHKVYRVTISRLRGAGRFSEIQKIIEAQKKYPDISKEGFCVRLISLYGKSGMFSQARNLFDEMPRLHCPRSVRSFNSLLSAAKYSRQYERVLELFHNLPSSLSVKADVCSYNILVHAYCRLGSLDDALTVLDTMHTDSVQPNLVTFTSLLNALYGEGRFSEAEKVWSKMEDCNIIPDVVSFNAKLRGLALHGKIEEAVQLVDEFPCRGLKPDGYSYTALIKGFCQEGNPTKAKDIYNALEKNDCVPNRWTFEAIIPGLIDLGELDLAIKIAKDSISRKIRVKRDILQALVDVLVKEERADRAQELIVSGARRYSLKLPSLEC